AATIARCQRSAVRQSRNPGLPLRPAAARSAAEAGPMAAVTRPADPVAAVAVEPAVAAPAAEAAAPAEVAPAGQAMAPAGAAAAVPAADGERAGDPGPQHARRARLAEHADELGDAGPPHRAQQERALRAEVVQGHAGPGRRGGREHPDHAAPALAQHVVQ